MPIMMFAQFPIKAKLRNHTNLMHQPVSFFTQSRRICGDSTEFLRISQKSREESPQRFIKPATPACPSSLSRVFGRVGQLVEMKNSLIDMKQPPRNTGRSFAIERPYRASASSRRVKLSSPVMGAAMRPSTSSSFDICDSI